ncbi:hypothetical protein JCGZ_20295 [Jatropha curcas]|uniref:Terpene synthase N-terminal domain-containing protein n=1 Tax=Jatropha curcas TaxID=180498 RepID=A0A067JTU9_JATCU|nr:hypothetical protein JCGZ_20295 [Jatropha curcas]
MASLPRLYSHFLQAKRDMTIYPSQKRSSSNNILIINRHITSSLSSQISEPAIQRKSANYQPTTWSYNFVQSLNNVNADRMYKEKAKKLEEEVRSLIKDEDTESLAILEMVDDIQRLGLGHRFQNDIKQILEGIWCLEGVNYTYKAQKTSLHASALTFRLLRQHGYQFSQDVFRDFMDEKGQILASLKEDANGILSLYEASYLALEGELLLDKAIAETSILLKNIQSNGSEESYIKESIRRTLELPLHQRALMLDARWYIELYSKKEDANHKLLELAKLDFNMRQSVLQRDLKDIYRYEVKKI